MDVGTRVREHREAAGMRQDQLAELCHVSRQTVSNWERNKTLPDIVSLKVMANELGTTVDALVGDDVPEIRRRADERARALAALFTANMLFSLFVEVSVTGSAWNLSPRLLHARMGVSPLRRLWGMAYRPRRLLAPYQASRARQRL